MLYLLRFSDIAKIDIEKSCLDKIKKNKKKYPIKLSKGNSKKYIFLKNKIFKKNEKKMKNKEELLAKALKKNIKEGGRVIMGIMPDKWIKKCQLKIK